MFSTGGFFNYRLRKILWDNWKDDEQRTGEGNEQGNSQTAKWEEGSVTVPRSLEECQISVFLHTYIPHTTTEMLAVERWGGPRSPDTVRRGAPCQRGWPISVDHSVRGSSNRRKGLRGLWICCVFLCVPCGGGVVRWSQALGVLTDMWTLRESVAGQEPINCG